MPKGPRMSITRVAVAGLGAIGRVLARKLSAGRPGPHARVRAARDHAKGRELGSMPSVSRVPWSSPRRFRPLPILRFECAPASPCSNESADRCWRRENR